MSECTHCCDGWVCEQHPIQPWPHKDSAQEDGECAGPGIPCVCSPMHQDNRED